MHGAAVPVFHWLSVGLIALMFFLQGARLSRKAVLDGMVAWKLHLLILSCTFILFPLLGLAAHALFPGLLQPDIWMGVLFLCCLPSTVQSSIAFTSIAGGNVPAAVCAATASNVFGIFITPVLVGLVLSQHGQATGNPLDIVYQLLLPFILGQVLQPWLGAWAHRNKKILSFSDRGSVLVVVYAAFSDAVMQGLWHRLPMAELGMIAIADSVLLFSVLGLTIFGGRLIGLPLKDEIAVVFCGSKKTLASGVPMANVLFPPAPWGLLFCRSCCITRFSFLSVPCWPAGLPGSVRSTIMHPQRQRSSLARAHLLILCKRRARLWRVWILKTGKN